METIKSLKKGAMQTGFAGINANGTTFNAATSFDRHRSMYTKSEVCSYKVGMQ